MVHDLIPALGYRGRRIPEFKASLGYREFWGRWGYTKQTNKQTDAVLTIIACYAWERLNKFK